MAPIPRLIRKTPTATENRLQLIENGYLPIPVNGKRPRISNWSKIVATAASVTAWERGYADHLNTGILTGQVVAVDVDAPDEGVAARLSELVRSVPGGEDALCRVGRAPKALYVFRAQEPREKASTPVYIANGHRCQVEVLGAGQQFVAFGVHPDTGRPYEWIGSSPLDVGLEDLPVIGHDDLDRLLTDAEKILAELGQPEKQPKTERHQSKGGETFWQRVNSEALAAPERWVTSLFPSARREAGTGAWRVTSKELGRPLQEDISIHADGIQDFGKEQGETAINLVTEYGGAPTAKDAALWLCERLGLEPADMGWSVGATTADLTDMVSRSYKQPPVAANDNKPDELDIFAWRASRFVGEPEPTEYLVSNVIETGIPVMVASMGEVGKSFALLELSRRVAFGSSKLASPIFGGQVVQEGTAVFLAGEDDARAMHRRLASLDPNGARFADKGDKLITIPMPSAVKTTKPFWRIVKGEPVETAEWRKFCDSLLKIDDLRLVTIDPLQLFAAVPLNEDPAAGQFVCASVAALAAQTKASVFIPHHMAKRAKEIMTLADARDAIRGTSALVDGVRLAYALWYAETDKARKLCKTLSVSYEPNRIVHGGVVKANGAARRILSTYARAENGLLIDRTANLGATLPEQGDLRAALVIAVEGAAADGKPFTKTGAGGLYELRERLPEELQVLSKSRLGALCEEALQRGEIVRANAKGEKVAKWLDVPTGMFAIGLGNFGVGAMR